MTGPADEEITRVLENVRGSWPDLFAEECDAYEPMDLCENHKCVWCGKEEDVGKRFESAEMCATVSS